MEISRKSPHPLDVDSRPNWGVTRKVGGKVVLRSDMDAAREPVQQAFQEAKVLDGKGRQVFFGGGREFLGTQKS